MITHFVWKHEQYQSIHKKVSSNLAYRHAKHEESNSSIQHNKIGNKCRTEDNMHFRGKTPCGQEVIGHIKTVLGESDNVVIIHSMTIKSLFSIVKPCPTSLLVSSHNLSIKQPYEKLALAYRGCNII